MGLRKDIENYEKIGEENREDLIDFIKYGDMSQSDENDINLKIKIIDLPEFVYDFVEKGGVGSAPNNENIEEGQIVNIPIPEDGDDGKGEEGEDGEPGEEGEKTDLYNLDPEEFAELLDKELELNLEPKGKKVKEEVEGSFNEIAKQGVHMDDEYFFKQALKRKLALDFDEKYVKELLKIKNVGPKKAFSIARNKNINVSLSWIQSKYDSLSNKTKWESLDELEQYIQPETTNKRIKKQGIKEIPFRKEDERYKQPEIVKEYESQVVVVNIRDVSGSVGQYKRDLIQRTLASLDWYLNGKYDNAEFVYIAHNVQAWETDRTEFFNHKSGGGTRISSAYELAQKILEERYPWNEWNRYVFAAGDGENRKKDTKQTVIPLMEQINATEHAYIEVNKRDNKNAIHGSLLERYLENDADNVTVNYIRDEDDITTTLQNILGTNGDSQ